MTSLFGVHNYVGSQLVGKLKPFATVYADVWPLGPVGNFVLVYCW